jgi:hypothetical protein
MDRRARLLVLEEYLLIRPWHANAHQLTADLLERRSQLNAQLAASSQSQTSYENFAIPKKFRDILQFWCVNPDKDKGRSEHRRKLDHRGAKFWEILAPADANCSHRQL